MEDGSFWSRRLEEFAEQNFRFVQPLTAMFVVGIPLRAPIMHVVEVGAVRTRELKTELGRLMLELRSHFRLHEWHQFGGSPTRKLQPTAWTSGQQAEFLGPLIASALLESGITQYRGTAAQQRLVGSRN